MDAHLKLWKSRREMKRNIKERLQKEREWWRFGVTDKEKQKSNSLFFPD